ncbi:MAG TPA: LOG family protein, partial [Flavihumibacter sp.]|nr:LOG family protein [Flavihumibacter sp.]
IRLPFEQHANPYMDKCITFDHFFVRKTLLIKYSYAFIIMPGGVGTMDEFFETLTLVQTGTLTQFPIVLIGKAYYQPLVDYMRLMVEEKTMGEHDLDLVLLTDDISEAMEHIRKYITSNYKIKPRKKLWWLFERK